MFCFVLAGGKLFWQEENLFWDLGKFFWQVEKYFGRWIIIFLAGGKNQNLLGLGSLVDVEEKHPWTFLPCRRGSVDTILRRSWGQSESWYLIKVKAILEKKNKDELQRWRGWCRDLFFFLPGIQMLKSDFCPRVVFAELSFVRRWMSCVCFLLVEMGNIICFRPKGSRMTFVGS